VDIITPFVISIVGSDCRSTTVSSAFRIMGLNDLPVTRATYLHVGARDETGGTLP
jgi:hypothetical protein